ncbi:High mobility group protein 20A [Nosema bombycis CQ1]|uniref:High mobility group protein 20A n=2 Tax=Nosema bombycis TaxID=27978 RepID=R0KPB9_NOSB1|nr:HMG1 protein [Nosema bombycis]EOB12546.1 High mobility group protein 20A [Nosema bombycis CQ1]|eukprot:EOB12546.1 High mobility group protein 20A [Nosema bombycis CQ1]
MTAQKDDTAIKKRQTAKKPKDKNAPKPPLTPYLRFGAQQRAADKTITALPVAKQGKVLAEMWSKLSDEAKNKFKEEYTEEKAIYDKNYEEYKKTDDYKKYQDLLKSLGTFKEKKTKRQSAYNVYYKEQYGIIASKTKGLEMKDITAIIVKNWKEIDEPTKKIYAEKAKKANDLNKENKGEVGDSDE